MIRGVTFDWWHTIAETPWPDYDERMRAIRIARVRAVLETAHLAVDEASLYVAYDRLTDLLRESWSRHMDLTAEEQIAAFLDVAGLDIRNDGVRDSISEAFGGAIRVEPPILYPNIADVLGRLRRDRYRVGLISNTGRTWGRILRPLQDDMGIGGAFHIRIFSDEVRVRKPDRGIFETALSALGLGPHEVLHIGDDVDADVAGAKAVGMRTIWFNTGFWPEARGDSADTEIHDHSELPAILARWSR